MSCPYGGRVSAEQYPSIPVKEGFYADWDIKEISRAAADENVTVEYVRYLTTLAGSQVRENGQSAVLVDGSFKTQDSLTDTSLDASQVIIEGIEPEEIVEHWQIAFPDDGSGQHKIRYQAPEGQTEGIVIYEKKDGQWIKAQTELMGIYHLFTIDGTSAEFAVCNTAKGIMEYIVYIAVGVLVLLLLIIVIIIKRKHKKKKNLALETKEAEVEEIKSEKAL